MIHNFFLFFKEITKMIMPLEIFRVGHLFLITLSVFYVVIMLRKYARKNEVKRQQFLVKLGFYFIIEEIIYSLWVLLACKQNAFLEIVPLQLCSMCVYMNVLTLYFKKDYLKFFCAIITTTAGLIALIYPANLNHIYPLVSYRTLNFFILHATFIVFGIIQMKELKELKFRFLKQNMLFLACMTCAAYLFNLHYHTDYMFIGSPPTIGFIRDIYQYTGVLFFIPVVLCILFVIQVVLVVMYRFILAKTDCAEL